MTAMRSELGLLHERVLSLTHDGAQLFGEDRLVAARAGARAHDFVLRFHLHPQARVAPLAEGAGRAGLLRRVACRLRGQCRVSIEESVFFAGAAAARKCAQLVVDGRGAKDAQLRWSFTRVDER